MCSALLYYFYFSWYTSSPLFNTASVNKSFLAVFWCFCSRFEFPFVVDCHSGSHFVVRHSNFLHYAHYCRKILHSALLSGISFQLFILVLEKCSSLISKHAQSFTIKTCFMLNKYKGMVITTLLFNWDINSAVSVEHFLLKWRNITL